MTNTHSNTFLLSEIWIYPIKSIGGMSVQNAVVGRRGLRNDRRWMLVDETGKFVTQREIPSMALMGTALEASYLKVFWKHTPSQYIQIPLEITSQGYTSMEVKIWDDTCEALILSDEINQWFSIRLGQNLRLVFMPDATRRPADARYAPNGHYVSFADGYPYLLIGQSSLDALNTQLEEPLPINRFRPNFVVTGAAPFEEDTWSDMLIGEAPFRAVKPCARCIIPTTDQDTGLRAAEPLKTLSVFRKFDNKILFGQNVLWTGEGEASVRVGEVLKKLG